MTSEPSDTGIGGHAVAGERIRRGAGFEIRVTRCRIRERRWRGTPASIANAPASASSTTFSQMTGPRRRRPSGSRDGRLHPSRKNKTRRANGGFEEAMLATSIARAIAAHRQSDAPGRAYFCHVRFLWRLAFKRLRRLCLFIFRRRFFFRLPMVLNGERSPCSSRGGLSS